MPVARPVSYPGSVRRVFELAFGQLLWSRRTIFMALVVAAPVALALAVRLGQASGALRIEGAASGAATFGVVIWVVYLWFVVPVLGIFYGTALIADEVEEKTITYLFTRPLRRGAVLVGKYLAYLVCTTLMVLPSVMLLYFVLVPLRDVPDTFRWLVADLGLVAAGLAAYGALFALVGAALRRPLLVGLIFAFGWEPLARLLPGYLNRLTVAYYLHALVPHAMPPEEVSLLLQAGLTEPPALWLSLAGLAAVVGGSLWLAARVVESREYVLEQ